MTSNHFKMIKMIRRGKIMSYVSIPNSYFNWWVWGFGKNFPVGLPETHPKLWGSQPQIMNRTRQTKAHTNRCAPSLSLVLTTKKWRRRQAILSSVVPDSTIRMHLDNLLTYRTSRVHARGSSISMWQSSWFNQRKISLSVNQSTTPKGVVSLLLRNPCILGGPEHQARGQNHKWPPHPCLLGGP